jgi:hypothetical protein
MQASKLWAMSWNEESKIHCEFTFKCPKFWDCLQPTPVEDIRHCPECDRDVHLARNEEQFRRHAGEGKCVAVKVLQAEGPREVMMVGNLRTPYHES